MPIHLGELYTARAALAFTLETDTRHGKPVDHASHRHYESLCGDIVQHGKDYAAAWHRPRATPALEDACTTPQCPRLQGTLCGWCKRHQLTPPEQPTPPPWCSMCGNAEREREPGHTACVVCEAILTQATPILCKRCGSGEPPLAVYKHLLLCESCAPYRVMLGCGHPHAALLRGSDGAWSCGVCVQDVVGEPTP